MFTDPISPSLLHSSVIAVPPLARDRHLALARDENARIIRHIENGGVKILLYGGNANLYHIRPSEYGELLFLLASIAGDDTLVIPAVGPAYGTMMDQAALLAPSRFPTAMVLPMQGLTTSEGVREGITHFAKAFGRPIVLYIKDDAYIDPDDAARLVDAAHVSFIKYAIVRDDPETDPYLLRLVRTVDPAIIVSGMGEQPAIVHREDFGLTGFTSGCVCVNPALSQAMLEALNTRDLAAAAAIRVLFEPLEDLRNAINPVRVLHEAVALAGIADTGPALPLLSNLSPDEQQSVRSRACTLLDTPVPS